MKSLYDRQLVFLIFLFIAFLLVIGALIYVNSVFAGEENALPSDSIATKKSLVRYQNDDIVIDKDQRISSDVVIQDGMISISGEIDGDVIALQSDVIVRPSAIIYGNIYCYLGDVRKDDGAKIAGDIIRADDEEVDHVRCRDIADYEFPYHIFADVDQTMIEKDETISGDIFIFESNVDVRGKIDGDVISLFSEITIQETAAIDGHVLNYEGEMTVSPEALITGERFDQSEESEMEESEEELDVADDEEIRDAIEDQYVSRDSDVIRFMGDVTIKKDEIINGSIVVMKGTTTVSGEVNGDVVSILGDIEMDSTAYVSGDVVSVGGKIYRDEGSYVGGDVVQTHWTGVKVDNGNKHVDVGPGRVHVGPREKRDWDRKSRRWSRNECDNDEKMFEYIRYNRVEGLFLGFYVPKSSFHQDQRLHANLYGHAGYGIHNKRGRYQIGLEKWIFDSFRFTIGGELHDLTDTQDDWIIPTFENSLAAILIREDFRDYYRRVGGSAYLAQNITENLKLEVGYHKDQFYNMPRKTNWSVFGGDKKFRENPLIDEIEMKSVYANVGLDTRNDEKYPQQGWYINLMGEFAGPDLDNDQVDFDRFILDIRRFQPIGYGENLDFRLRMGSSRGQLPAQFRYDLGGLSSLRGYHFKEFEDGDRMVLGNAEYRIYGSRINFIGIDDLNFILFADAGLVWNAVDNSAPENSFEQLTWDDLKTDMGFALSNYDGNVRLSFTQRLDDRKKPVVITFRIRRPF